MLDLLADTIGPALDAGIDEGNLHASKAGVRDRCVGFGDMARERSSKLDALSNI